MPSTQPFAHNAAPDIRRLKRLHRVGLLAILLIATIVAVGVAALEYSARWVQHTREVLRTVRELQSGLLQIESRALQTAVIQRPAPRIDDGGTSGNAARASTTRASDSVSRLPRASVSAPRTDVDAHMTRLLSLTADNDTQQERARRLAEAVDRWAEERSALLRGDSAVAIDAPTAALQQVLHEFQTAESNLYGLRVARQQRWRATLVVVVMAALTLVAFALHRMTRGLLQEAGARVRVQAERDRTQALLDFALDRSPLAVAVLEADNDLRVANDAWSALAPSMHIGAGAGTSHHGSLLSPELEAVVARVRRTGEPAITEMAFEEEGAARGRTLLVSAHRIESESDSAVGLVLLDLSEQRWLETQLRHAQRMEALGRLAGGVAHDINNVVTAIVGFTDMAIAGVRSPDDLSQVDGDLQQVRRAADRAAVMAKQLLSFSRQRPSHERPIDVSDVVHDIEPMLRRILGSHVQFHVQAASTGWAVRADPGQIEQVVLNLAINARDAMERGGELTISVSTQDRAQIQTAAGKRAWHNAAASNEVDPGMVEGVCLTVRDTGSGIPPSVQARMFDPFFTTKAEGKGTGLGLATVRQIVDELGGFVTIQSRADEGTAISVYLPRTPANPEPLRFRASRTTPRARSGSVLVAEDDRDVRYLIEHVLSDAGYVVHTARNGREALSAIERSTARYHLLLTDLVMPDVGGVGLGSHALVEERVGRVLYMSGYAADSYGEQTALPSHVRFLSKPFSPAELLAAVDEAMHEDIHDDPSNSV